MLLTLYRLFTILLHPLLWGLLLWRGIRGKQEWHRLKEAAGFSDISADVAGAKIIWLHAASVGETMSVLPLVEDLLEQTQAHILFTTTTRTAAGQVATTYKDQPRITHRYAPFDSPFWVARFLNRWQPSIALRVESEIWANTIIACHRRHIPHILINGRISTRSYRRWKRLGSVLAQVLAPMQLVLAQDEHTQTRFAALGVKSECLGNLKLDAPPLPAPPKKVEALRTTLGTRPFWLAASTHKGEEVFISDAHKIIEKTHANILTIIAPRHPERGDALRKYFEAQNLSVAQRSKGETPTPATKIYLADTLGELGVFFSCVPIVAMGGTFLPFGGHNALEAVRHQCAVIHGGHTDNFTEIFSALSAAQATLIATTPATLAKHITDLVEHPESLDAMIKSATAYEHNMRGARQKIMSSLNPIIKEALNA